MYQRPKLESFTLPNVERPFIYKDPPRSIHTRQWAPISEADTTFMLRDQVGADRMSESISYLSRGTNPMVDVDFSNAAGNGARTLTMHTYQGSNPYKAVGAQNTFRPPLQPLESLQPLSRARYLNPAVQSNPVVPHDSISAVLSANIDRRSVNAAVNDQTNTTPIQATPSFTSRIALPTDIMGTGMIPLTTTGLRAEDKVLEGSWSAPKSAEYSDAHVSSLHREVTPNGTIILTPLTTSSSTNPSFSSIRTAGLDSTFDSANNPTKGTLKSTNKQLILQAVQPNFALVVHDVATNRNTHITGSTKDKTNIAVKAALGQPLELTDRTTGNPIKIKDYRWQVIQTPAGGDLLMLSVNPNNDITQQKLMDLTLEAKISGGPVSAPINNINSGVETNYRDGVLSMQQRSTNPNPIHTPGLSMFKSTAAENTQYQGGSSMNDRQAAAGVQHMRKEARKARASDVRGSMVSSVALPTQEVRTLKLRRSREAVQV